MNLRCWALLAMALTFSAKPAFASSYLATAALLLDETRRSDDWMSTHYGDTKLAEIMHELAEARVKCGRLLLVPKEVERAHPHLLLALETSERAMAAAVLGESKHFVHLVSQALDQARTFRAVLAQGSVTLPELAQGKK